MSAIYDAIDFGKASSGSLVRLQPCSKDDHWFYSDYDLAALTVDAIATQAPVHLSGPSGTGKTHFLNSLLYAPQNNFECICRSLGLPMWAKLKPHRIFLSTYETPGEIWYRTEVVNFTTLQKQQAILDILTEAANDLETLHVVWLVESGRGVSPSIQGGWLEIIGQRTVREPHGREFQLRNVTWVTDSNHAANRSGEFAIWDLDQAYGRRWTRRVTVAPLAPDQEMAVLRALAPEASEQHICQVVTLAAAIREKQLDGGLRSILPPTIDAELDLLGCICRLPLNTRTSVFNTMLGHCVADEREDAESAYAGAFGVQVTTDTPAAEAVGIL